MGWGMGRRVKAKVNNLKEISDDNYARELMTFMGHVDKVSKRRWKLILDGLHHVEDGNDIGNEDLSIISEYCANIFVPSSPIKG